MHTSPGLCGEDGGRSMIGEHRKQCSLTVGVPVKSKTMSVSCADHTKLKRIKAKADDILKSKKVFVVRGPYKAIRRGMRHRGWVEKDYSKGIVNENAGQTSPEGEGSFDNSGDYPNESSEEDFSDEDEYCLLVGVVLVQIGVILQLGVMWVGVIFSFDLGTTAGFGSSGGCGSTG